MGPFFLCDVQPAHTTGFDPQKDIKVRSRGLEIVLGDVRRRVGVIIVAELGADGGKLVPGECFGAVEHHMFKGVCRSRKTLGRVDGAHFIIEHRLYDGCQSIPHNHDTQAIGQSGTGDGGRCCRGSLRHRRGSMCARQERRGQHGGCEQSHTGQAGKTGHRL